MVGLNHLATRRSKIQIEALGCLIAAVRDGHPRSAFSNARKSIDHGSAERHQI
jgi:hypothetical protein